MHSYFRSKRDTGKVRHDAMQWVSISFDSLVLTDAQAANAPANPIAFQVHGGTGAFPNARGTWYRNIKVRELDSLGRPLHVVTSLAPRGKARQTMARRPGFAKPHTRYEVSGRKRPER
jgi:hypothetical protein